MNDREACIVELAFKNLEKTILSLKGKTVRGWQPPLTANEVGGLRRKLVLSESHYIQILENRLALAHRQLREWERGLELMIEGSPKTPS